MLAKSSTLGAVRLRSSSAGLLGSNEAIFTPSHQQTGEGLYKAQGWAGVPALLWPLPPKIWLSSCSGLKDASPPYGVQDSVFF